MRDKREVADCYDTVRREDRTDNRARPSDLDLAVGPEVEERAVVDTAMVSDPHGGRLHAPTVNEREAAVNPSALPEHDITRKGLRKPVVFE
jgi:hypothetical protein